MTVSKYGVRVEISPKELYHSDFLTANHDGEDELAEHGCVIKNLLGSLGEEFIYTELDRPNSCKSWYVHGLSSITEKLLEDIKEAIVGLIESSLSPHEGREWMPWQKSPDPEIEESGNLSLILRQKFVPLFDSPMSSFSDVTTPLHLRLTPPPEPDLF